MFACMVDMYEERQQEGITKKGCGNLEGDEFVHCLTCDYGFRVCMVPKVRKLYTLNTGCSCAPATTAEL